MAAPSSSGSRQALKVIGLLVLGGVALCGVAGTCLLVVSLVFSG